MTLCLFCVCIQAVFTLLYMRDCIVRLRTYEHARACACVCVSACVLFVLVHVLACVLLRVLFMCMIAYAGE